MSNVITRSAALLGRIFFCAFVILLCGSLAEARAVKKPKLVQPSTQEGVVKRALSKISPQAYQGYRTAISNPAERPTYTGVSNYRNPAGERLKFGPMPTREVANGWLQNTNEAPDLRGKHTGDVSVRQSTLFFQGRVVPVTREYVRTATKTYGSLGGGILLEGSAENLGEAIDLQYDSILNALILNERDIYFSPVSPQNLAVLCRAIAANEILGVSIGEVPIIYGKHLPDGSQPAIDLKKADRFLTNIALGRTFWIDEGYAFANNYILESVDKGNWIYQANLNGFKFETNEGIVRLARANFDLRIVPISDKTAADGGFLADENAIAQGSVSPFDKNIDHLTKYIADYRIQKSYIDRVFQYGEVAAFLRALKADDVDLEALAELIEKSSGVGRINSEPPAIEMQAPITQLFEAWKKRDAELFIAQWSPNAVQSSKTKRLNFAELGAARRSLFAALSNPQVWQFEPIYYGFKNGVGYFYNSYRLSYVKTDGVHEGGGCEIYKVRQESGRWLIIENIELDTCDLN